MIKDDDEIPPWKNTLSTQIIGRSRKWSPLPATILRNLNSSEGGKTSWTQLSLDSTNIKPGFKSTKQNNKKIQVLFLMTFATY